MIGLLKTRLVVGGKEGTQKRYNVVHQKGFISSLLTELLVFNSKKQFLTRQRVRFARGKEQYSSWEYQGVLIISRLMQTGIKIPPRKNSPCEEIL